MILSAVELSEHFTPKKIPRGVSIDGKVCFYYENIKKNKLEAVIVDEFKTLRTSPTPCRNLRDRRIAKVSRVSKLIRTRVTRQILARLICSKIW